MARETKDDATSPPRQSRSNRSESEAREGAVGDALRIVYERTVSEQIPPDLLDLLGKLD